jgi:hypothetical protein
VKSISWLDWIGVARAFRVYGKGKAERNWRVIDIVASPRRNMCGGWPIIAGTCITWSARMIAVGWDFAESVLREQIAAPVCRDKPLEVFAGRLRRGPGSAGVSPANNQMCAGERPARQASEVLAHECGHTYQALRLQPLYLVIGGALTWWGEGRYWWNGFENQASATGLFGGIVNGSIHPELWARVAANRVSQ